MCTSPTSRLKDFLSKTALASSFALLCPALAVSNSYASETADTDVKTKELYVFNWSDYIDPSVLEDFTKETNIKVHYDLMDSNEILEAKLLAGSSGYDIVAPSLHVLQRLAKVDLLLPLNKELLPNLKHLDPKKMAKIAEVDPNNTYGIPYTEMSTGIAYNKNKVKAILGENYKVDSWEVIFNEDILQKLSACGVAGLDSPSDMLCSTLIYLGRDPESKSKKDYDAAAEALKPLAKFAAYFHNSKNINDLASGEICMSVTWTADAEIANQRAKEAGLDEIVYMIPKEGALTGYDMLAIPKDAKNVENAHIFLNYLMRPDVTAKISNYLRVANANKDATALMDSTITSNPGIYFDDETLQRLQIVVPPKEAERLMTRTWNRVLINAGKND